MPEKSLSSINRRYVEIVDATPDDLAFLLDNLGRAVDLDHSTRCVHEVEGLLRAAHCGEIESASWPDLVDTLAQLAARYAAVVLIRHTRAQWREVRKGGHVGLFLDVVPGEGWNRYAPVAWQVALRDPAACASSSLAGEVERLQQEWHVRRGLVAAIHDALAAAPRHHLTEAEIVRVVSQRPSAPDPRFFASAARRLPKRIAAVLRHSGDFARARDVDAWRARAS